LSVSGRGAGYNDADAVGFVLAGGQSSRMGQNKALVEFAGRPLVAHALAIFAQAGLTARIAGAAWQARASLEAFAPVIEDATPGLGPLSGICAALGATTARYAVFLSVDLPLLPPSLLVYLLHQARITERAVTVSMVSGFAQTFPAVIDREVLPALLNELNAGRLGCYSAFEAASKAMGEPTGSVAVELLAQSGRVTDKHGRPPVHWFLNLNSPADLARAAGICSGRIA